MSSCTRRSYGGGLIESLRRAKSKLADLTKPGASFNKNQIKVVQNQVNGLQKQLNEKNALKGAQIMFQKANNNAAAAATQAVNAAKAVAVNLHKANQNRVTPSTANTTTRAAINNAAKAVSQSNELLKLAKNLKETANKLQSMSMSGGKRRTRRIHRK